VCKLDKSRKGLKQAPKHRHEIFDNLMLSNEYKVNERDKFIYYEYEYVNNICTIMSLYKRLAHVWFKDSCCKLCETIVHHQH